MSICYIDYDDTSGSNTAASGAGPATAVTGTGACHNNNTAGATTWTLTNSPDLSGVAADGTAVIWVNTATGNRHLYRITAVDDGADTVTVDTTDAPAIASGSAVDYAIGGVRKNFTNDSGNEDYEDWQSGYVFRLAAGTYTVNNTWPTVSTDSTSGPCGFVSTDPATVTPVVDVQVSQTNGTVPLLFDGITLTSSSTSTFNISSSHLMVLRSTIQNTSTGKWTFNAGDIMTYKFLDSVFDRCQINNTWVQHIFMHRCVWKNGQSIAGGFGSIYTVTDNAYTYICDSEFYDCAEGALEFAYDLNKNNGGNVGMFVIERCTFDGNDHDAIKFGNVTDWDTLAQSDKITRMVRIVNNSFTNNGGYGINASDADLPTNPYIEVSNNFYDSNTSGDTNNITDANPITGTPGYTDQPNNDYSLTSSSDMIGAGLGVDPLAVNGAMSIGAHQWATVGGGGSTGRPKASDLNGVLTA